MSVAGLLFISEGASKPFTCANVFPESEMRLMILIPFTPPLLKPRWLLRSSFPCLPCVTQRRFSPVLEGNCWLIQPPLHVLSSEGRYAHVILNTRLMPVLPKLFRGEVVPFWLRPNHLIIAEIFRDAFPSP